jgi:hypothetical protein
MKKKRKGEKPEWQVRSEANVRRVRELAQKGLEELAEKRKREAQPE